MASKCVPGLWPRMPRNACSGYDLTTWVHRYACKEGTTRVMTLKCVQGIGPLMPLMHVRVMVLQYECMDMHAKGYDMCTWMGVMSMMHKETYGRYEAQNTFFSACMQGEFDG